MLNEIKNKILIMSGSGGVGKTTIAVNLAYVLSKRGFDVGLLDTNIHGSSVPKMFNLKDESSFSEDNKILPIEVSENLQVMSISFLKRNQDKVIWRGPLKDKTIRQFIENVSWNHLDYLVVDSPPGISNEVVFVSQLLKPITGSVIVSMPQEISLLDVEEAIDFSRKIEVPVIGVVENMSGDVFGKGKVKSFSKEKGINFLGSLELAKAISKAGDEGKIFMKNKDKNTAQLEKITTEVVDYCKK